MRKFQLPVRESWGSDQLYSSKLNVLGQTTRDRREQFYGFMSESACDAARRLLLDAPESVCKALGVLAHGTDVIVHMPIGLVGATKVG